MTVSGGEPRPPPGPVAGPPTAYQPPPPEKTALPVAGGALLLVAGILAIINAIIIIAFMGSIGIMAMPGFAEMMVVCGIVLLILSLVAIIGGIFAIQRKSWGIALLGAILGLFTLGPLFVSSILSLIALILIAISKKEFS